MLSAVTEKGKLVNLIEYPRDLQLHQNERFFCPDCHERVIFKNGQYRIPHFAHQKHSLCASTSEPESEAHLQGKKDLFLWCRIQKLEVELEKYIPEILQRPDLLVKRNGIIFAIEYQCSTIPPNVIKNRTNGYLSANINPIWILGGFPYQKKIRNEEHSYHLSDFHWTFTQHNKKNGIHLFSYHSFSKRIQLLTHILPLTSRKVVANSSLHPLNHYSFPIQFDQIMNHHPFDHEKWFGERRKWIEHKMVFAKSLRDPFLSSVYYANLTPLLLPAYIGIPVDLMGMCRTHPVEWQFFIWHDVFRHAQSGIPISFSKIEGEIQKRVQLGHIHFRTLPLIDPVFRKQMMYRYLRKLVTLGFLKEIRKGYFIMNKSFPIPNNIEDVIELEKIVIASLNKI